MPVWTHWYSNAFHYWMTQPGLQRGSFGLFCLEGAQPSSSPTSEPLPLVPCLPPFAPAPALPEGGCPPGHCWLPGATASPGELSTSTSGTSSISGQRGKTDLWASGFSSQLLQEILQVIKHSVHNRVSFLLSSSACWDRITTHSTDKAQRDFASLYMCSAPSVKGHPKKPPDNKKHQLKPNYCPVNI